MDYEAKIKTLTQYQTFCIIPVVVLNVIPRRPAIDQQHAQNAALFRLGVSALCLIALVVLEVMKFRLRKAMKAQAAATPPTGDGVQYPRE